MNVVVNESWVQRERGTEQGLERGAALLQPVPRVRGGEEHRRWAPGEVQAETDGREEGLPPGNPAHLEKAHAGLLTPDGGGTLFTDWRDAD